MSMYDPIKLGIEPCNCGRLSTKVHCPKCGSYEVRAKSVKTKRILTNGQTEDVQVYRCRVCGIVFDDWDWQNGNCYAIKFKAKSTRQLEKLVRDFQEPVTASSSRSVRELHALRVSAQKIKRESALAQESQEDSNEEPPDLESDLDRKIKKQLAEIDAKPHPILGNMPVTTPLPKLGAKSWKEIKADFIKSNIDSAAIESARRMRIKMNLEVKED